MKVLPLLLAALALPAGAETLDASRFSKSVEMTVSGYAGSSTLANFPVLVRLSRAGGFSFADFSDPAAELRFADANGDSLDFEIDTWDASAGTALVWVSLPSLSGTATKFTAYFAPKTSSLPAVSAAAVWTKAGYVGVWHLNAKNAAGAYPDSSGGSAAAQAYDSSATFPDSVAAGAADYAIGSYVSANKAGLFVPAAGTAGWDFGATGLSVEFWAIPQGDWPLLFSNQTTLNTATGFGLAPAQNKFAYSVNGIGTKPENSANNGLRQCEYWWGTTAPLSGYKSHWRFVTVTWKSETSAADGGLYVGWPQDDTYVVREHLYGNNTTPVSTYPATVANGFTWSSGMYLSWGTSDNGKVTRLDEMRVRAAMTTDDWAAANYATQNKDAAFLTYGAVEEIADTATASTILIY